MMNKEQIRLRKKLFDNTINKISEIRNEYLTISLNKKQKKCKKHFPITQMNNIETIERDFTNNCITIKYKDNPDKKYYFTKTFDKSNVHSFTLSTMTMEEHVEYISKQLECLSNILKLFQNGNIMDTKSMKVPRIKINDVYNDITKKFNDEIGTSFEKVFAINVLPPHSFVTIFPSQSVKICVSYIIGISKTNLNIFFDDKLRFQEINNCRGLQKKILKYNEENKFKLTDVDKICSHLSTIHGEGCYAIGNDVYKYSVPKINGPAKIEFVKTVDNLEDNLAVIKELGKYENII